MGFSCFELVALCFEISLLVPAVVLGRRATEALDPVPLIATIAADEGRRWF